MKNCVVLSGAVSLFCLLSATAGFAESNTPRSVSLAAHRAVYDMTLNGEAGSGGIEAVNGRLVYEEIGNSCDGYTLRARQVINFQTETGQHTIDSTTNSYESGDGKQMRFKMHSLLDGNTTEETDGEAVLVDNELQVRIKTPTGPKKLSWKGDISLPNSLVRKILTAAQSGETTVNARIYDGTDSGDQVYETFTLIGHRIEPGEGKDLEEQVKVPELMKLARWPVKVSYFKEGQTGEATPEYSVFSEIYENGVSRSVTLNFSDFSVKSEIKELKFLPMGNCQR